jgi:uncharacterized phage protein gp47/JayE
MPWPLISLRARRAQVRDDIATHLPGADASVPNSVLRVVGDVQANLTHDNDTHLDWVAKQMMPDTAEGAFADRWGAIWLPNGRKAASYAQGQITVTGTVGATVPAGALLTVPAVDNSGAGVTLQYAVSTSFTLTSTSGLVSIIALNAGALSNLDTGTNLQFVTIPAGIDGQAVVASPALSGGTDMESDADLIARYVDRIQEPPHGGSCHDYVQWALEVPGVTRAWAAQEMGLGTVTLRFMMDDVRAAYNGFPQAGDLAVMQAYIDARRPVTVADWWPLAPVAQALNLTIADLATDTPLVRANIRSELTEMLRARANPGATVYASWIREAISSATGEDHHELTITDAVPASVGTLITLGTITYV